MALPVIPFATRFAVRGLCANGQEWANVFHLGNSGGAYMSTAQQDAAIALVKKLWTTAYAGGTTLLANMATAATTVDVTSTNLDGVSASRVSAFANAGGAGAPEPLPSGICFISSWRTSLRGPRNRGRSYFAGFTEDANGTSGRIRSTLMAALQAQVTGWLADLTTAGTPLVVASYKFASFTVVTTGLAEQSFAIQRRRNR